MTTKKTPKSKKVFDFRTINTIEAAFKKCGLDPKVMPDLSMLPERFNFLTTVFVLSVIFEAVNDGWKADYTDRNQYKYYPWPWVSSSGLDFSDASSYYGSANTVVGFPLCTDSRAKAIFILDQFPDLWKAWLLNVKPK